MSNQLTLLAAFSITVLCLCLLRPLALRIRLVDSPRGRKQHRGQVPLIGGIAIFLGFLFALLTLSVSLSSLRSFIAGAALLVFIGVLDDFQELSARARFVVQLFVSLIMIGWGKVALHNLGNLLFLGEIHLGIFSAPITMVAVVGIINALNMIDGSDGLAGGLFLLTLSALLYIAWPGDAIDALILAIMGASTLAFLGFNYRFPWRREALVFMGDAGSMLLGFTLAWFLIDLSQGQHRQVAPAIMLWFVAVPLFDTGSVILRRLQLRSSVFSPDREHLHHLLKDLGFSTVHITWSIWTLAAACILLGLSFSHAHTVDGIVFLSFLGAFAGYLWLLYYLRRRLLAKKA